MFRSTPKVAHLLLKMGADPNVSTKMGVTPFYILMKNFDVNFHFSNFGRAHEESQFPESEPGKSAALSYLPAVVSRLLHPSEVGVLDPKGNSVLHHLVRCGAYQQVRIFSFFKREKCEIFSLDIPPYHAN